MKSVCSSLLVVSSLAGLAACDLPYPSGAYEPEPVDVQSAASADAGMASPDGAVGIPGGGAVGGTMGGMGGTTGGGTEGGMGGMDSGAAGPLQELAGDYFVRVDQYNTSKGAGMTVQTHLISYLVAKLLVVDGVLTMYDRQCYVDVQQQGATTTIPVAEQTNYYPARRPVNVNFGTGEWSTERGPYAVGWDYDFTTMPDRLPPTSDSDPLVRDNNADGPGVNVRVTAGLTCNVRITQKIDLLFSGALAGGKIVTGECTNDSKQATLKQDAICPSEAMQLSNGPDTVRFAKASSAVTDTLPCPNRSVMSAALPSP